MGLCKCPKRKVTNLFCFEHRVNVCEHCLVANHAKCIVKSYLQWLQDSDYNPVCTLCSQPLADEEYGECVRLTCYDVFHWLCLNRFAQQLPANTAPAGYTCPTCNTGIFPQSNMATPVADALRTLLQQVNWARAGLGLPLIDEPELPPPPAPGNLEKDDSSLSQPTMTSTPYKVDSSATSSTATTAANFTRPSAQVPPYTSTPTVPTAHQGASHSVINVDEGTSARGFSNPRKLFDSTKDDGLFNQSHDHDDDKYKRRSAFQFLARWFKSREGNKKKDPASIRKRFFMVLILGIVTFITLVIIFSQFSHNTADDPFLDPLNNPNIKVEQKMINVNGLD